jgi:hypothetical protein
MIFEANPTTVINDNRFKKDLAAGVVCKWLPVLKVADRRKEVTS